MIYYFQESLLGISLIIFIGLWSVYTFLINKNERLGIILLIITAFLLRLFIIQLDPFLHNWDERYHALVAKNMMEFPFQPMLRLEAILPYDVADWSSNHVWLHKQPLFLWQMALSMKIFGINEFAIRLPSAIMGSICPLFIYQMGNIWLKNKSASYLAAILCCFSYYQLELCSGRFGLDHNDLCFGFYFTGALWAFFNYHHSIKKISWLVLIGLFVGAAVLVKWLTALALFGAWGLYLLLEKNERNITKNWMQLIIALLISAVIFLPWQIYIHNFFPLESSAMHQQNLMHITDILGTNASSYLFHLEQLSVLYHPAMLLFFPLGIWFAFKEERISKSYSWSMLSIIIVVYLFFSFVVKTKMPAYPILVHGLVGLLASFGILSASQLLFKKLHVKNQDLWLSIIVILFFTLSLKPFQIAKYRSINNQKRNDKIANTKIYKSLDIKYTKDRFVLNVKQSEDVELMFHTSSKAYHWFPPKHQVDSLLNLGYRFSAFSDNNGQNLPNYIMHNDDILIIQELLH